MRFKLARKGAALLCLVVAMGLSGCFGSTQPSRFYMLSSLKGPETAQLAAATERGATVAVGPLIIPDYLDRPEIVTRAGQNEVRINEYQRWSGTVEGNLSRAIIGDLSVQLPSDHFSVVRWIPAVQGSMPIAYRVMVDVMRFDAFQGGAVFLESDWTIYGKDRSIELTRKSSISGKAGGPDFTDLVAAMSKAAEDLSREIAAGITSLEQKEPAK